MQIQRFQEDSKGYFKAMEDEKEAGRMTFTMAGAARMIIDHTEVNPDFKGRNVGKQLVNAAVDYARETGIKILPLCPFAKSVFDRTPEIRDVL
jgi:predicted GNAT family acetyltransferase